MTGYKRFSWNRIKTAVYRQMFTNDSVVYSNIEERNHTHKSTIRRLKEIFIVPQPLKWDFCKQSFKEMSTFLDYALERYDYFDNNVPLVMISHSKDFLNKKNFESFLKHTKERYCGENDIAFSTMTKFIKNIKT
jgi:hypothetical protein